MPTEIDDTPAPLWRAVLGKLVAASELHPAVADAAAAVAETLVASEPPPTRITESASLAAATEARDQLAAVWSALVEALPGAAAGRRTLNLISLATSGLAVDHGLPHDHELAPCRAAHALALALLRDHSRHLRPVTRALLLDVRDGVALDDRRTLAHALRRALDELRQHDPLVLDVADGMGIVTIGGIELTVMVQTRARRGPRVRERPIMMSSIEGRLALLVAAGRPPQDASAAAESRVRGAVERATGGGVQLLRRAETLRFVPALELTERARRALRSVRTLRDAAMSRARRATTSGPSPIDRVHRVHRP